MATRIVAQAARDRLLTLVFWTAQVRYTRTWAVVRPACRAAVQALGAERVLGRALRAAARTAFAGRALELDEKLWGGFSNHALEDLEALRLDERLPREERSTAAWALGRWYAYCGDYERALNYLDFMAVTHPLIPGPKRRLLLASDCLLRLGRGDEARQMLKAELVSRGEETDLCLAYANICHESEQGAQTSAAQEWLRWINRPFINHGAAPLALADPERGLTLDNLTAPAAKALPPDGLPRISVIVPAHNAQDTIHIALNALLAQTWTNTEILVVDDCSTDGTYATVCALAEQDARVVPLRHDCNRGAYAARNTALQQATGEFITTHDGDDWSHPQKLETQVRALLHDAGALATVSYWSRVTRNLFFTGGWRAHATMTEMNHSSFMFRREVTERLGAWDAVRVAGDTEFIWRVQKVFGEDAVVKLHPKLPLSFALTEQTSLTQRKGTHVRTIHFGLRREYRQAARWWHASAAAEQLKVKPADSARPFPAPAEIQTGSRRSAVYDVVLLYDLALLDEPARLLRLLADAAARSLSVAVYDWPHYDLPVGRDAAAALRALVAAEAVDVLTPGQQVWARTLIIGGASLLRYPIEELPEVGFEQLVGVADSPWPGGRELLSMAAAQHVLQELFTAEARWLPLLELRRHLVEARDAVEVEAVPTQKPDRLPYSRSASGHSS